MAERERIALIGGSRMLQTMQSISFIGARHSIVRAINFEELSLGDIEQSISDKNARVAVVNLRRDQVIRGRRTGEGVVASLREGSSGLLIVVYNEEEGPNSVIPGADMHVKRVMSRYDFSNLTSAITKSPKRRTIDIPLNRFL